MTKENQSIIDRIEKEVDNSISDWVDEGYSLGEIWTICQKILEKVDIKN